jgi:hypothetical protein
MSDIARLATDRPDPRCEEHSQLITLDSFQRDGRLEDYARFRENGVWLRRESPFRNGTRVVLHLLLPEVFTPIILQGTVVGQRPDPDDGAPWMLVWFDACRGEDHLLLRRFLGAQRH